MKIKLIVQTRCYRQAFFSQALKLKYRVTCLISHLSVCDENLGLSVVAECLDSLGCDLKISVRVFASLLGRPVLAALSSAALDHPGRHHHDQHVLLPHHPPEVFGRLWQRTCNEITSVCVKLVIRLASHLALR